jgi:putative serine protease PepD
LDACTTFRIFREDPTMNSPPLSPRPNPRRRHRLRRVSGVAIAAVLGGTVGAAVEGVRGGDSAAAPAVAATAAAATSATAASKPVAITSTALSAEQIYQQDGPGVVDIQVTGSSSAQADPFGRTDQQQAAEGSGFVLDTKGDIVTNYHVIEGATKITVTLADGTSAVATLVGSDASSDLAVIRISVPSDKLVPLTLATSGSVDPGEPVVAIGSPFGYAKSITEGIVSGVDRQMTSPNDATISGAIQTDAAINPGNSGGPLIDGTGAVIGVNAQIKSSSDGNEGVGFAIPIGTVQSVTADLIAGRTVSHPYLGVSMTATGQIAAVEPGSPAAAAGLQQGDVVTAVDSTGITSAADLSAAIADHAVGDKVVVTVNRGGESSRFTVTLAARAA